MLVPEAGLRDRKSNRHMPALIRRRVARGFKSVSGYLDTKKPQLSLRLIASSHREMMVPEASLRDRKLNQYVPALIRRRVARDFKSVSGYSDTKKPQLSLRLIANSQREMLVPEASLRDRKLNRHVPALIKRRAARDFKFVSRYLDTKKP